MSGFTIPPDGSGFHTRQSELDTYDIEALAGTTGGTLDDGIYTGGEVTENSGGADMSVDVAAATYTLGGNTFTYAGGNVAISAADATNPRFDLVTIDDSGTVTVSAGTPAASPRFPTPPAGELLLAAVYVPATDTAITTAQVIDKRRIRESVVLYPVLFTGDPGGSPIGRWSPNPLTALNGSSTSGTATPNVDDLYFFPFPVPRTITLDGLGIDVTTGTGTAGHNARLGIYRADPADGFNPSALVVDAGEVNINTSGNKTITGIGVTLTPGFYWKALTLEAVSGGLALTWIESGPQWHPTNNLGVCQWGLYDAAAAYGALPSTAPGSGTLTRVTSSSTIWRDYVLANWT